MYNHLYLEYSARSCVHTEDIRNMTFSVFDIVVLVIALVFCIIGFIRGGRKIIFGLIASLGAFIGAIVLSGVIGELLISSLPWYETLSGLITDSLSPSFVYGGNVLEYRPDGDLMVLGFFDGEVWHLFADAFEGSALSSFAGILEGPVQSIYTTEIAAASPMTLPAILGSFFASLAFKAVCFIVLFIVLMIIVKILNRLIKKLVTGTHLGHFFDRVIGLIIGLLFAIVLIMIVLSVLQVLSGFEFMAPVKDAIDNSLTGSYLTQYNFIYTLLDKYWGISSIADSLAGLGSGLFGSGAASGSGSGSGI